MYRINGNQRRGVERKSIIVDEGGRKIINRQQWRL